MNLIIRFVDADAKRRALGKLASRFSGKSWASGEMMVPPAAVPYLASEGIPFCVERPATNERMTDLGEPDSFVD